MKLKDYSQAEITAMSYDDIAFMILSEENKKMKINELFRKVADIYQLSDDAFVSQIGDFFELLSTDQRFIMLEDGYWDLKSKHSAKIIMDEEDEEDMLNETLEEEEEEYPEDNEEDEEIYYDTDETDDPDDDELQDLVVVDEEDEEPTTIV